MDARENAPGLGLQATGKGHVQVNYTSSIYAPAKPEPLPVNASRIPEALKERAQWVVWKYEPSGAKWTKVPYQARIPEYRASTTNPETWASFDVAWATYQRGEAAGIGFAFAEGDGLAGIDLDHCWNPGTKQWAREEAAAIFERFQEAGAYIERSPGGDGIRFFVRGSLARWGKGDKARGLNWIEAYDYQSPRYLTVTGRRIKGSSEEPQDGQEALDWLVASYLPPKQKSRAPASDLGELPEHLQGRAARANGLNQALKNEDHGPFSVAENKAALAGAIDALDPDDEDDWRWVLKAAVWTEIPGNATEAEQRWYWSVAMEWAARSAKFVEAEQREKMDKQEPAHPRCLFNRAQERGWRNPGPEGQTETGHEAQDSRPEVRIVAGERHRVIDDIQRALGASGQVFQMKGALYALTPGTGDRPEPTKLLCEKTVGTEIARRVRLTKYLANKERWAATEMPMDLAKAFIAEKQYPEVPHLTGIARQPFLRQDGSLCDQPGYDLISGMYCTFDPADFPTLPRPTRDDAVAALDRIRELFKETPLAKPGDRAAVLAACLTAACRRSLAQAPMFLHTSHANGSGAGKNYCECLIEGFASATPRAPMPYKMRKEELDKSLLSALMEFPDTLRFDELAEGMALCGSPLLLNMLSEPMVSDRILGASKTITVPSNVLIQVSGNGTTVKGDMRRRVVELFYAPAEVVSFEGAPLGTLRQKRGTFVADALTVVRAFRLSGMGRKSATLPGFGQWDRWIRQALVWLGEADPAASLLDNVNSTDDVGIDMAAAGTLLERLRKTFTTAWFTAAEVSDLLRADSEASQAFRRVAGTKAGDGLAYDSTLAGKVLANLRELPIDVWRVERKEQSHKAKRARQWRIRKIADT